MPTKSEIVEFYNRFALYQQKAAFNERHAFLYGMLEERGLGGGSTVLELGCGIGVITSVMARRVRAGSITAVDISPDAISAARKNCPQENVAFVAADILGLDLTGRSFDFITLFDVIEHIPFERHPAVFKAIGGWMHDESVLMVNIPNPAQTRYLREHGPHKLQVIDLEVTADLLTRNAYQNGLVLDFFMTYSLWQVRDYQVMVFRRRTDYKEIDVKPRGLASRWARKAASWLLGRRLPE